MIVAVQPKEGSKSGQRQWKLVADATPPTQVESKKQRKQRLHREEMVQFRLRKKLNETKLRTQHSALERQMQRRLAEWKKQAIEDSHKPNRATIGSQEGALQLRDLILQTEALRVENATLTKVVANYSTLHQVIYAESDHLVKSASKGESSVNGDGWRVTFPNGEPSFHFHAFTESECAGIVQRYDQVMTVPGSEAFMEVGTLFGWRVERLPLVQHVSDKWVVTRVRFSKRIHCAARASNATMYTLETESWKVLTTPELWTRVHRAKCTSLKLQEVDEDTVVIVSNTPQFEKHLRYLMLMHRRRSTDEQGKRTITFAMVIPDSEANKRSREAENSRGDVLWVCEGGGYTTLRQIDESTLEVTYDNCAGCKNELQAQHLLIEWGQEALRWEQLVTPSRLLTQVEFS